MKKKVILLLVFFSLIAAGLYAVQNFNSENNILILGNTSVLTKNDPHLWFDPSSKSLTIGKVGGTSGSITLLGSTSGSTVISVGSTGASTTTMAVASTPFRIYSPPPGNVAWTAINTNGTAGTQHHTYCTSVYLPVNKTLTGIAVLNGTTVGNNNSLVALYSATGGADLAHSALAGAATANASTYQEYAFTATYAAVGPARYFACTQVNGTDTIRMAITGVGEQPLTKDTATGAFGTPISLTVPTSFTTAVGPYVYLY